MKTFRLLIVAATAALAIAAQAQVPIPPFVSPLQETFDALPAGSTTAFIGFGGQAGFSRVVPANGLIINNSPAILPPISAPNDMFGRGADVRIRFQSLHKRFGGRFRVPNAGIAVNMATFRFFNGAALVGVAVGPVNNFAYNWHGYDLSSVGGFDRVEISGNGSLPGYVGMDNLVAQ